MVRYSLATLVFLLSGCRGTAVRQSSKSEFAPPGACDACHPQQAKSYRAVAMARSLYVPTAANIVEDYTQKNHFFHAASSYHYRMIQRGAKFFQRRYQLD